MTSPLFIMAWDTASNVCSAAVMRIDGSKNEVLAEYENGDGGTHSKMLPPQMKELLTQAQLKAGDLNLVAVGRGPGSFTGLRTGLALAKGLGMGAGVPVMGISTLETLACQLLETVDSADAVAAPVLDARHMEIFTALYKQKTPDNPLEIQQLLSPTPIPPDIIKDLWESGARDQESIVIGGAAYLLVKEFIDNIRQPIIDKGVINPSAKMLARIAGFRFQSGLLNENPALPLYIRQPDIRQSSLHF